MNGTLTTDSAHRQTTAELPRFGLGGFTVWFRWVYVMNTEPPLQLMMDLHIQLMMEP